MTIPTYATSRKEGSLRRNGRKIKSEQAVAAALIVFDFATLTDECRRLSDFARMVFNSPDLAGKPLRDRAAKLLGEEPTP